MNNDFTRIEYTSSVDGLRDWAMRREGAPGSPLVVVLHGHGSHGDQLLTRRDISELKLPHLRAADVGVLCPNLRDNAWMSPAAVEDLAAMLRRERAAVPNRRLIITGGSMGGTGVFIFAMRHPELVDACLATGAATALDAYMEWLAQPGREHLHSLLEALQAAYPDQAARDAHSVALHADALPPVPTIYVHGGADEIIPIEQAHRLTAQMTGRPNFHYSEVPNGNHDSPIWYYNDALDTLLT